MENISELTIGTKVVYDGLGKDRVGTVIKKTKSSVTIKLPFSTVRINFNNKATLDEIGVSIVS